MSEAAALETSPGRELYVRHARNVEVHHADLRTAAPDARPPIVLDDVAGDRFDHVQLGRAAGVPAIRRVRPASVPPRA